jgi:Phage integrase family
LREGIDTANATGRMVAGVLASLAELELELGTAQAQLSSGHGGSGADCHVFSCLKSLESIETFLPLIGDSVPGPAGHPFQSPFTFGI